MHLFMPLEGVEPSLFHKRREVTRDDWTVHLVLPYFQPQNIWLKSHEEKIASTPILAISRTYASPYSAVGS
jgi:hypothetical protein